MIKFRADRSVCEDAIRLIVVQEDDLGARTRSVALPLAYHDRYPGMIVEPTVRLSDDEARVLMDELWNLGVRPSNVGSAGQLAAVQYHLEDMRRLVFNPPHPAFIVGKP